jgi:hypothetical protein
LKFAYSGVANELEQRAIRVAEVHAGSFTVSTIPGHRSQLDFYFTLMEMLDEASHVPRPDEAEITATWSDRNACDRLRDHARAVHIQAHVPELVHPARALPQNFRAHHVKVEGV